MFAPITLGRTVRVAKSETFFFTETAHERNTTLPDHAHERPAISYVLSGRRRYHFASQVIDCEAGSVVFIPAGETHATEFLDEAAAGLMIECRFAIDAKQSPDMLSDASLRRMLGVIHREMVVADDLAFLALEFMSFELQTRTRCERVPAWLGRVRELLQHSPPSAVRLSNVAASAGVDRSTLTRGFRRHYGVSIGNYVRLVRMSHAWQLLTTTRTPLADIAARCGFADQPHLTREFRRWGVTPGQVRRARMPRSFKTPGASRR